MKNWKKNYLNVLTAAALVFLSGFATAQTVKFSMGPELPIVKRTVPNRFIHGDNNSTYLLKNTLPKGFGMIGILSGGPKVNMFLDKYDGKFNLLYNKDFGTNLKDLYFEDLIWAKGKFIMFTSRFDKGSKMNTAYGNFVDEKGNIDAKAITLMNLVVDSKRNRGAFDFYVSDDSTKFMVYAFPPYDKNGNQKIAFSVYGSDLVKQWQKVVELPYKDKMVYLRKEAVSNNGDVFILAKKFEEESIRLQKDVKKGSKGKEANYKYVIFAYTNQGNDFKEYALDLGGKFVVDPTFKIDPYGNLAVAGFYTDKFGGSEKGIFYMTVDAASQAVKTSNMKEFSSEIIDAFGKNHDESKSKGSDQGLSNFDFKKFVIKDDGGAVILAENHYVIVITHTDGHGNTYTTYQYYYNDIIAMSVNPKGEIEWFARIPKRQMAGADASYLSFSSLIVNDKIYIIYNDNKKNDADSKKTKFFNYRDGVAVVATIDASGNITKNNLLDLKDNKTILYARLGKQISPNSMAVYMEKSSKYRLGSVVVE